MPKPARKVDDAKPGTTAVHGARRGQDAEPLTTPIAQTTTFGAPSAAALDALYEGDADGWIYTRYGNPTNAAVEEKIALLEGTEHAITTATGMAAITLVALTLARSGGRIVAVEDLYGGTASLFRNVLPRLGIRVDVVPTREPKALAAALDDAPADLVYLETPTNPVLRLCDLKASADVAREHGVPTVVDSTFASPVNSRPHDLGIDVVLHSVTKYLAGHADVMGGVVCADAPLHARLRATQDTVGATMDPHAAFLLDRGLKTLHLRVAASNANATALARHLDGRAGVARVHYPGLDSHPQRDLAKRQMPGGCGGLLAFDLPSKKAAYAFLDALRLARNAASLGAVETLVSLPVQQSHRHMTDDERARMGITPGTVRFACGVEDVEDIVRDVDRALDAARAVG